jgi:hypothetical protein
MSRTFKQDYKNGLANELVCVDLLAYYFEETFQKLSPTHHFDFESPERFVELKSRTCSKTAYPTTMIGYDKVLKAEACGRPVHFAFLFRDGSLWEVEYKKSVFDSFECSLFQRDDRADKVDICKQYCYIPVGMLSSIGVI